MAGSRAVVFDLFHTLTAVEVTSARHEPATHEILGVSREAWNRQLLERSPWRLTGRERDPAVVMARMARALAPEVTEETIRRATASRMRRFELALVEMPADTVAALRALRERGKRLGLVSNADLLEIAAWPRCPAAPLFDATVFSCHAGFAKPAPEIYQACLRALRVEPREAVFVGDGGSGELEGARRVGMRAVLMAGIIRGLWPGVLPERAAQADAMIEESAELLA